MKRILAMLCAIFMLACPSIACAEELIYLCTNGDFAFYNFQPQRSHDYGGYCDIELVLVPLTQKMVSAFRAASGGLEPGKTVAILAFDNNAPRQQITKWTFIGEDGRSTTQNFGFSHAQWEPIPSGGPIYDMWLILTGRR